MASTLHVLEDVSRHGFRSRLRASRSVSSADGLNTRPLTLAERDQGPNPSLDLLAHASENGEPRSVVSRCR